MISGMSVFESFLMKGFVLVRGSEGTIKHVDKAKIVIFGTEVDLSATETKGNVLIKNAEEVHQPAPGSLSRLMMPRSRWCLPVGVPPS